MFYSKYFNKIKFLTKILVNYSYTWIVSYGSLSLFYHYSPRYGLAPSSFLSKSSFSFAPPTFVRGYTFTVDCTTRYFYINFKLAVLPGIARVKNTSMTVEAIELLERIYKHVSNNEKQMKQMKICILRKRTSNNFFVGSGPPWIYITYCRCSTT